MKNMILGALVSLTAISCVSVDGQKVDKDFTWQTLGERGLSVAETQISNNVRVSGVASGQLTNLLATEIRDEREDLKVKRIAKGELDREALRFFKLNNDLEQNHIEALPVQGRTYIVMSSVIDDNIGQGDDEKKNDKDVVVSYEYSSYRKMTVAFKVYDLEKKKVVWTGDVNKRLQNSKTYAAKEHRKLMRSNDARQNINAIGGIAQALTGKEKVENVVEEINLYPDAPTHRAVLKALFEDFADALPEKGMFD